MKKGRLGRVAALLAVAAMMPMPHAEAANTYRIATLSVRRGALSCVPNVSSQYCTPTFQKFDSNTPVVGPFVAGKHLCAGTSLASTTPVYECRVSVGATVVGTAPRKAPVSLTFVVTSDDGNPWGDDVRRTLRATPQMMQPPAAGVPAPCTLIPPQDARISCKKTGPRTWTVSASTSTDTGLYTVPLQVMFPSSTGTEPVCEFLRIKGTAKIGTQTLTHDLGRKKYCA